MCWLSDSAKAKLMLEKVDWLAVWPWKTAAPASTITQEVDLLDAYLNIQKIRLGERLAFSVETHEISDLQVIPPFLIQPLVENALTHGIEPKAAGGQVNIRITQQAEQLKIEVSDSGAGLKTPSANTGYGVGLKQYPSKNRNPLVIKTESNDYWTRWGRGSLYKSCYHWLTQPPKLPDQAQNRDEK